MGDGAWYASHCELHRQACVKRHHIRIDHAGTACERGAKEEVVKGMFIIYLFYMDKWAMARGMRVTASCIDRRALKGII